MNSSLLAMFAGEMHAFECGKEKWKKRIKEQWRESAKLPRKKKKRKRKELLIEWNICNYDPFNI